jgi:twitching motility protein PilI
MRSPSLREFQADLAERIRAANATNLASWLGVAFGGRRWFIDLADIYEVVDDAQITPVPRARPWFEGVVNVRGTLYGCTNLAAYFDLPVEPGGGQVRLLLAHPRHAVHAALRVERTLGLHSPAQWPVLEASGDLPAAARPYVRARRGVDGSDWHELDLARLFASTRFLDAAA